MGGLARRVSYIKAFKQRSNTEVPTLLVDAGNLFADDRFSAAQLPAEVMTKNKWVVKGYGDFHHDAANISYNDLPYLTELLKKDGYDKRVGEYPFIERLISANIQPLDDQQQVEEAVADGAAVSGRPGRTRRRTRPAGPGRERRA